MYPAARSHHNALLGACLDRLQRHNRIACKVNNAQLAAGVEALRQLYESVVIQAELLESHTALHRLRGCSMPIRLAGDHLRACRSLTMA